MKRLWHSLRSSTVRASAGWGAVLSGLLGLGVWLAPGLGDWLEALSFDALHVVAPAVRPADAAIVALDEESARRLGQSPDRLWDRALHARLVETLFERGARAVVFDILFADPWPDPTVDARFAGVLERAAGKVVLAASVRGATVAGEADVTTCVLPTERLADAALWGVVETPMGPDRVLREHPRHAQHPSLAAKTVEALGRNVTETSRSRWIRFYGPPGTVRAVSCWQALEPATLPPDVFTNRVVFVGRDSVIGPRGAIPSDAYATPLTRWTGRQLSGVEVQATLFLNLWRGDWIEQAPPAVGGLILLLGGAAAGFLLARLGPRRAFGVALAGMVLAGFGAWALCWGAGWWFPWLILGGVQVPFALGWSVLGFVQRAAQKTEIPDHTLVRCIGRGAYGDVWLARDAIGGYHAVKRIERGRFPRPEPFEREFRGLERFAPVSRSHPGLVHVLHVGRNELRGAFYYIMEIADDVDTGQAIAPERYAPKTLAAEIARHGRLPAARCVELGLDLAAALDHLHRQQLVHRDIKPANVIFVGGRPKLADAGLVTGLAQGGGEVSRVGTEGYLAPEGPGTASADVYSLGKVLYEAATGCECWRFPELPTDLGAASDADVLVQLHEVLLTACETDPADRYATAAALRTDLLEIQAQFPGPNRTRA